VRPITATPPRPASRAPATLNRRRAVPLAAPGSIALTGNVCWLRALVRPLWRGSVAGPVDAAELLYYPYLYPFWASSLLLSFFFFGSSPCCSPLSLSPVAGLLPLRGVERLFFVAFPLLDTPHSLTNSRRLRRSRQRILWITATLDSFIQPFLEISVLLVISEAHHSFGVYSFTFHCSSSKLNCQF